ncbi:MAG: DUF2244 domain-containing protein [Rhodospirillaceae bacterium]|jgi:uncharacterized membrane protein|nr:DUF2244 domain-containing protein [Rhodospirillaceae bacterium]MBT3808743.1 DUF2244 domain-containing protein [Rhodospirillaceae bacterium]MBT3930018.1 DUF2244 domain-containing protein [Rhodospirillaceae bacterium]MBT4772645.1 DUF2244 domain-containing protein [Rhodospirillaceae bacterium]MBT5358177.1 DUF2244 domain-containing protein [Rhodospirillaceae bacterium]
MAHAQSEPIFDAVLTPHRSLSPRGVRYLLFGMAGMLTLVGAFFAVQGAWPVLPFFGCEILLFWWAFRTNARDGRRFEHLRLTPDAMTVARVRPSGQTQEHKFAPPHWLAVELTPRPGGDNELRLASHGHSLKVGGFLTPEERDDLANALRDALRKLRSA